MIETLLYYVLVDSISFQLQEVLCIWRILESYNITSSTQTMENTFAMNAFIPKLQKNVKVKEWRPLFECAVAGLKDDAACITYIPFAVQRSSAE